MIKVGGIWELGWSVPITEAEMWWTVLREFNIGSFNMTPITGIDKRWVQEYPTFEDIIKNNTDCVPVFVDEKGDTELKDFVHPENALYLFGRSTYSPFSLKSESGTSVRIGEGGGMLWPHQALSIILYDRINK